MRLFLLLLLIGIRGIIYSQCTNNNTIFTTVNVSCPGSINIPCVMGGQYVLLNVVAGNVYTFSTCGGTWDTQITLYNNSGGGSLGYNDDFCGLQSQLPWTSTFTGQLRILIDLYFCTSDVSCTPLNISCYSCNPAAQTDCIGAFTLCSNASFNNNSNNIGCSSDLNSSNSGCLISFERQGTWYIFSPSIAGTLFFNISPTNPLDDYDFAVWGPYPNGSNVNTICPVSNSPLRCSYSALTGNTGLGPFPVSMLDLTEGAAGDKWVRYLDVFVGEVYLLYIDNGYMPQTIKFVK